MGATTFSTAAWGKTPAAAFSAAVEQARYMSGHGGYTGTIAEKHGFRLFELPPRVTIQKIMALVDELEYDDVAYRADDLHWKQQRLADAANRDEVREGRAAVKKAEKQLADARKARERFAKKCGDLLELVKAIHQVHDDKWGDAVAFRVTAAADKRRYGGEASHARGTSLYLFCGYASC